MWFISRSRKKGQRAGNIGRHFGTWPQRKGGGMGRERGPIFILNAKKSEEKK